MVCDVRLDSPKVRPTNAKLSISTVTPCVVIDENGDHSLVSLDPGPSVVKTGHASLRAIPLRPQKLYEIMEDTIFFIGGIIYLADNNDPLELKCIIKRADALPALGAAAPPVPVVRKEQKKKEQEEFLAPVPLPRPSARQAMPIPRISDTMAATQVLLDEVVVPAAKKEEFVDIGVTQVMGDNDFEERAKKARSAAEQEALKNAATLPVQDANSGKSNLDADEDGDTQKLEDMVEETKETKPKPDIERAKWVISNAASGGE